MDDYRGRLTVFASPRFLDPNSDIDAKNNEHEHQRNSDRGRCKGHESRAVGMLEVGGHAKGWLQGWNFFYGNIRGIHDGNLRSVHKTARFSWISDVVPSMTMNMRGRESTCAQGGDEVGSPSLRRASTLRLSLCNQARNSSLTI